MDLLMVMGVGTRRRYVSPTDYTPERMKFLKREIKAIASFYEKALVEMRLQSIYDFSVMMRKAEQKLKDASTVLN